MDILKVQKKGRPVIFQLPPRWHQNLKRLEQFSAASAGNGRGGGGGNGGNGNDELSTLETEVREMVKKGIIGRILRRTIEIMYCRDYDPTSCKPL